MDPLREELFEELLAGELDTLEGPADAAQLWRAMRENPVARKNYDLVVRAMRGLARVEPALDGRAFCQAEEDMMWPVVFGQVLEDSRRRTGLSKASLSHAAVPALVSSIVAALGRANLASASTMDEVSVEVPLPGVDEEREVEVALTSVGGEISVRLHDHDNMDVQLGVGKDGVSNAGEGQQWDAVSQALSALSEQTQQLLGQDALVNCRVTITKGKAEVHLRPLHVEARGKR